MEGLKAVDIDVCKKSIDTIKGQIYEAQKKFIDYNRLRYVSCECYDGQWTQRVTALLP